MMLTTDSDIIIELNIFDNMSISKKKEQMELQNKTNVRTRVKKP